MKNKAISSGNLTLFIVECCRYLRQFGYTAGSVEELEILQAFRTYTPPNLLSFRTVIKAIVSKNRSQFHHFDQYFDQFWHNYLLEKNSKIKSEKLYNPSNGKNSISKNATSFSELKSWLFTGMPDGSQELFIYSDTDVYTTKDFSEFANIDTGELDEIIRKLARSINRLKSRRFKTSSSASKVDLRKTFQKAAGRQFSFDQLQFKKPRIKKIRWVILCDVSRSMELYSRLFFRFMYSLNLSKVRVQNFVFSTSISHLNPLIRETDLSETLQLFSKEIHHWSGGTRIGECFEVFLEKYGDRYLSQNTSLIILSDGMDTGETSRLEFAMKQLKKKTAQIAWLNPLAGRENYRPETKGMITALPYVNLFLPAHNIESLRYAVNQIIRANFYEKTTTEA